MIHLFWVLALFTFAVRRSSELASYDHHTNPLEPSPVELQKRTFSRPVRDCPAGFIFLWSYCLYSVNLKEYIINCQAQGEHGNVRLYKGRCKESEFCDFREELPGDGMWPNDGNAVCKSHQFYVNLAVKAGFQQLAVQASQLGLPSGSAAMAGYAIKALVTDEIMTSLVNVTAVNLMAVIGGGGSSGTHCEECNRVGLDAIGGGVTRFILGVTTDVVIANLKVMFDVWAR
ncbi:hypothetical protein MMC14_006017 [Varicellaria rhodocarpa]|nr:hypothetical protein [Varicellaria rhodocarpa]